MARALEGFTPYKKKDAEKYNRFRWWPGLTFGDLLDRAADIHPDKEAFVDRETRLTYGEAREKTDRLAIGMMNLGIRPLDRVLIQLPNWNEFVFAYFAVQKISAIAVLLIDRLRQFEISHLISLTGATSWIVPSRYKNTDYIPTIHAVLETRRGLRNVITVRGEGNAQAFPSLEKLIEGTQLTEKNRARLARRRPDPMDVAHRRPPFFSFRNGSNLSPPCHTRAHKNWTSEPCGQKSRRSSGHQGELCVTGRDTRTQWRRIMGEVQKTVCRSCHGGCGVIAHVQDGRVIKVEGDPDSPISYGSLCSKGLSITQLAYHPDRVRHPMKKVNGKWERVSWDEALDTIAAKFRQVINDYGPEHIVVGQGTGRDYESHLYRFANQLGTPNVLTAGHMCYVSRVASTLITIGNLPICDYRGEPRCIVMWGCNPQWTNPDEYKGVDFWRAYKKGAKLIMIDPRRGFLAKKADLWLQIRPGTDAALAMGFHSVIIEEGLYDKAFVADYINDWDAFKEKVREYPLDKVEEITWIDRELIREAARMYATTKPACIHWGVPTEQTNNCTDCTRIMTGLMAATGNLDTPGGNVLYVNPPTRTVAEFSRHKDLSAEMREKRLGGNQYKLGARVAFITPKVAWESILTGKPYQLKAGILCGTNPVSTRANAKEAYEALKKLDFLVVIDFFLTPTAELADIFLPAATWLEANHVADNWKRHGFALARKKCVEIGECWQDQKIFQELGKKMGQEWWDTVEDALDYLLEPAGLTWEQFKEKGCLQGEMVYHKYKKKGFSTPTGKVELYSTILEKWGFDPLPKYTEIPESPYSTPEVATKYPYILNAGLRTPTYFHSANFMVPWLREIRPDPIVEIHPDTARKEGIGNGQWVVIESPRGRIKQRAKLNDGIDPRVIVAEHGWWFPEIKDPGHGWDISNVNILTDNSHETMDPAMGATNLRVCLCSISPVKG